jgi:hypothetical protein
MVFRKRVTQLANYANARKTPVMQFKLDRNAAR